MDEQSGTGKPEKKAIGGDLVIPVAALFFTLYYFTTIIDSPWTAQVSAFFVGAVLIILVTTFFVRSWMAVKSGEANLHMDSILEARSFIGKRLAMLALTLGYIIFVQWGGFTLTTFAFLALAMLLLSEGRNWRLILILSGSFAIGGYLLFIVAFERRFPLGPFELLMKQVL